MSSKELFDRLANDYQGDCLTAMGMEFLNHIKRSATPHMVGDVADIGCGGVVQFDPDAPRSVTLVDISPDMLRALNTPAGDQMVPVTRACKLVIGDACAIPLDDESQDSVMMNGVLHHLAVPSVRQCEVRVRTALGEIRRILRPGGTLVLGENCPSWWFRSLYRCGYPLVCRPFARSGRPLPYFFSRGRLCRLLGETGLKVVEIEEVPWGRTVYNQVFPRLRIPGWLWARVLRHFLFIGKK